MNLTFQQDADGGTITDDDRNDALVLRAKGQDAVVDARTGAVLGNFDDKSRARCCCGGGPETYVGTAEQIELRDRHVTRRDRQGQEPRFQVQPGPNTGFTAETSSLGVMKGNSKKLSVELDGTKVAKISYKTKLGNSYKGKYEIEILEPGVVRVPPLPFDEGVLYEQFEDTYGHLLVD
ncbi:hypothetical protein ACHAWF_016872 [Thalassiosira exigua]